MSIVMERCCARCAHVVSEHKAWGCICCGCPEFIEADRYRKRQISSDDSLTAQRF